MSGMQCFLLDGVLYGTERWHVYCISANLRTLPAGWLLGTPVCCSSFCVDPYLLPLCQVAPFLIMETGITRSFCMLRAGFNGVHLAVGGTERCETA